MKQLAFLVTLAVAIAASSVRAELVIEPTLSVRGEAVVEVPADQVEFQLGVETSASTAAAALEKNSSLMKDVRKQLSRQGILDSEFKTGSFSVQPQWSPRPHQPPHNWRPQIIGYVANNQLEIKTTRLEKIGDWISSATDAGANNVGRLQFSLKDPDSQRSRAIQQATGKARRYAASAAEAAEVTLAGITSIQVDDAQVMPMMKQGRARMEMAMLSSDAGMAPELTAGNIEVRASVSLIYKIAP